MTLSEQLKWELDMISTPVAGAPLGERRVHDVELLHRAVINALHRLSAVVDGMIEREAQRNVNPSPL